MRTLLTFCLLVTLLLAHSHAQSPALQAQLIQLGRMKDFEKKTIEDQSISTGQRTEGAQSATVWLSQGAHVKVSKVGNTIFGADYRFSGMPKGKPFSVFIRWRYPEPGVPTAAGGRKLIDEYTDTFDTPLQSLYWIVSPALFVPGKWTLEVLSDTRLLVRTEFYLSN